MQNKTITMYELIELIKVGKEPEKIKYKNVTYYLTENIEYRDRADSNLFTDIYDNTCSILDFIRDTVEILPEENDEWEDIEEYDLKPDDWSTPTQADMEIQKRLNAVIKNQKYLKAMVESLQRPFTDEIRVDIPKWIVDPKKEKLESKDE